MLIHMSLLTKYIVLVIMGHGAIKHSCCILQLYIHKQLTIHLFFLRVEFKKETISPFYSYMEMEHLYSKLDEQMEHITSLFKPYE